MSAQTFLLKVVHPFMVAAALYFIMLFACSLLVRRLERRAERARA